MVFQDGRGGVGSGHGGIGGVFVGSDFEEATKVVGCEAVVGFIEVEVGEFVIRKGGTSDFEGLRGVKGGGRQGAASTEGGGNGEAGNEWFKHE